MASKAVRREGRADPDRRDPPPSNSDLSNQHPESVKLYRVYGAHGFGLASWYSMVTLTSAAEAGFWNPVATISTGTANARSNTAVVKRQRFLRSCLALVVNE